MKSIASTKSQGAILCLTLLASLSPLTAQGTTSTPSATSQPAFVKAWPKLSKTESAKARKWLTQLASEDGEVTHKAVDQLSELGAGAAPKLLRALGPRTEDAHEGIKQALDRIVSRSHTQLLTKELKRSKLPAARQWIARFFATRPQQTERHHSLLKSLSEDKDEEVAFLASLGLCGLDDFEHIGPVLERVKSDWRTHAKLISKSLEPVRGSKAAIDWLAHNLRPANENDLIAALRLARSLCPKSHARMIQIRLDSERQPVKKAAINALRAIVDGDAPLENLSVFRAIDEAKKWKAREL